MLLRQGSWLALLVTLAGACGDESLGVGLGGGPGRVGGTANEARRVIETLRARKMVAPARPAHPRFGATPVMSVDVLPPAVATQIDRAGGRLVPRIPEPPPRSTAKRADVSLGLTAGDGFHVEDRETGVAVDVRPALADPRARDAAAEVVDGYVVYRGGPGGGDIVHRPAAEGTEDLVVFERAPARAELSYDVELGERAAGLRLVADTLEVLDAQGTPRLRMAAPWVVDAAGVRRAGRVEVSGCAVDRDPRWPWGRPVTAAGAARCEVRVTWEKVTYPAVVDPAWTTTGSLVAKRASQHAITLPGGKVFVVGGVTDGGPTEAYDPTSGTWASLATMGMARSYFTATLLPGGKILVAGGQGFSSLLSSAQVYDSVSGTWTGVASMTASRNAHTASVLPNGRVLVAGGYSQKSAEVYDPVANTWTAVANMAVGRDQHTASVLSGGKVLVVGGNSGTASAEVYDPVANTWSAAGNLATGRESHTASVLASGKVLVVGGIHSNNNYLASAEVYDPATNAWTYAASMTAARLWHTQSVLPSGKVVVAGGWDMFSALGSVEEYDPIANTWTSAAGMTTGRHIHAASVLSNGTILVAGGVDNGGTVLASAELSSHLAAGLPCNASIDCQSGSCAGGVCCDTGCPGGTSTSSSSSSAGSTSSASTSSTGGAFTGSAGSTSSSGFGGAGGQSATTSASGTTSSSGDASELIPGCACVPGSRAGGRSTPGGLVWSALALAIALRRRRDEGSVRR